MSSIRRTGARLRRPAAAACALAALTLVACASPPERHPMSRTARRAAFEHSMQTATVPTAPPSFQEALRAGDRFRDAGDLSRAIWSYVRALDLDPGSTIARERIAYLHLHQDPERAAAIFGEVLQEHPDAVPAMIGLGLARFALGDLPAARRELEGALSLDPHATEALAALGVVYDRLGEHRRAQQTLRAALAQRPRDARIRNNLGVSHLLSGEPAEAEAAFRAALVHAPHDALVWNNLGLALGLQERYDEALQAFRQGGDEQAAHNNLGYVAALNGDRERAQAHYEHALLQEGDATAAVLRNLRALLRDDEAGRLAARREHHRRLLAGEWTAEPEPAAASTVLPLESASSEAPGAPPAMETPDAEMPERTAEHGPAGVTGATAEAVAAPGAETPQPAVDGEGAPGAEAAALAAGAADAPGAGEPKPAVKESPSPDDVVAPEAPEAVETAEVADAVVPGDAGAGSEAASNTAADAAVAAPTGAADSAEARRTEATRAEPGLAPLPQSDAGASEPAPTPATETEVATAAAPAEPGAGTEPAAGTPAGAPPPVDAHTSGAPEAPAVTAGPEVLSLEEYLEESAREAEAAAAAQAAPLASEAPAPTAAASADGPGAVPAVAPTGRSADPAPPLDVERAPVHPVAGFESEVVNEPVPDAVTETAPRDEVLAPAHETTDAGSTVAADPAAAPTAAPVEPAAAAGARAFAPLPGTLEMLLPRPNEEPPVEAPPEASASEAGERVTPAADTPAGPAAQEASGPENGAHPMDAGAPAPNGVSVEGVTIRDDV